ncbi:MAG TPA: hypothetical protein VE359_18520 [Vicinamibacteria bacterium]|nr:hypothetical protein [Vicinamibacteria bacterium]
MTLVATITVGFMGTYVYLMGRAGRASWLLYMVTAPFFAVGALLGFLGLRGLIRLLRFGHWHLDVAGAGVLGQPLRVTLFPGRELTPSGEIDCELRCLRVTVLSAGKSQRMDTKTLWESSWKVTSSTILKEVGLALSLPLPASGQVTTQDPHSGGGVKWQLTVRIPLRGMTDEPVFDVPVLGR